MKSIGVALLLLISNLLLANDEVSLENYFRQLSKLEFQKAKTSAGREQDEVLRREMVQLADILSTAGQVPRTDFDVGLEPNEGDNPVLVVFRRLEKGYISLFYDPVKGAAYREFYAAYQAAKAVNDEVLLKPCLIGMLEYYREEIAQNSDAYRPYLEQFQTLATDTIGRVWLTVYRSEFYTKEFQSLDSGNYFSLARALDESERGLPANSPMLANVFFEKALMYELDGQTAEAVTYYTRAIDQAGDYKFLRQLRFSSYLKLMMLAARKEEFGKARSFLAKARAEVDLADTLKTSYYLNLYNSLMLHEAHKNDSAFLLFQRAYLQDYQMDFRRNTLEINRLNVELGTKETENANLKLRQDKNFLVFGIAGLALLVVVAYLAYRNQVAKSRIQIQQKEMHSIRLEKLLKDQEIAGIDHMIEAQEKERQRIANELHDNLGSHLASIKLYFENLQSKVADPARNELFKKTNDLLEEAYQKVRTLAHARNVGVNSKDGLMPAVRSLASKISATNKLLVNVEEHGMDARLDNSAEILLFRIIQELLTNVIKHAKAKEVEIHLTRHSDSINLMVEDDGVGFNTSQMRPTETMGLHSIQKRIEHLGGKVTLDSIENSGTTIIIDLPV